MASRLKGGELPDCLFLGFVCGIAQYQGAKVKDRADEEVHHQESSDLTLKPLAGMRAAFLAGLKSAAHLLNRRQEYRFHDVFGWCVLSLGKGKIDVQEVIFFCPQLPPQRIRAIAVGAEGAMLFAADDVHRAPTAHNQVAGGWFAHGFGGDE